MILWLLVFLVNYVSLSQTLCISVNRIPRTEQKPEEGEEKQFGEATRCFACRDYVSDQRDYSLTEQQRLSHYSHQKIIILVWLPLLFPGSWPLIYHCEINRGRNGITLRQKEREIWMQKESV